MRSSVLALVVALCSLANLAATAVTLSTSPNPSVFGAPVRLTATVSPADTAGSIAFYDGVKFLGAGAVSSGTASISTGLLPAGSRKLRAVFRGAAGPVPSSVWVQTVQAGAASTFVPLATLEVSPYDLAVADFNSDGNMDLAFIGGTSGSTEWWQVDLGSSIPIGSIAIWNRTDCCMSRLSDYWVFVSNTPFRPTDTPTILQSRAGTWNNHQTTSPNPTTTIGLGNLSGRYVRVQRAGTGNLSLAEVQVFNASGINVGIGRPAVQSTTQSHYYSIAGAANAVDGNTNGDFFQGSVTHTSTDRDSVKVLLGNGDGTFREPVLLGAESSNSLDISDVNGDGAADIIVVGSTTDVVVFPGGGDGSFRAPAVSGPVQASSRVGASDFDGDGNADILVPYQKVGKENAVDRAVYLLPGGGNGTFRPPVKLTDLGGPFAIGDFNRDGLPDLAGVYSANKSSCADPAMVLGGSTSIILPAPTIPAGLCVVRQLAADFNGDGRDDLAVGASLGNGGTTQIFLSIRDGVFQAPFTYPVGPELAAGDFNGDGITDLAVGDESGLYILRGTGDGTFQQYATGMTGRAAAVADFNGDGKTDIAAVTLRGFLRLTILLGATADRMEMIATSGNPQMSRAGMPFGSPLQVRVTNGGVAVSGAVVTFTAPATGASARLSSTTVLTDGNGRATVFAVANEVPGGYVITASCAGITTSFSLRNQVVGYGLAYGTPQAALVGTAFAKPLQLYVRDTNGILMSGVPVTFSVPANGAGAILSRMTAVTDDFGSVTVTATANHEAGYYEVSAKVGQFSMPFFLTNLPVGLPNLALGRPATQSSTLVEYPTAGASSAVDGNTDGNFFRGSVSHTRLDTSAWWQVDLGVSASISSVVLWNRTDCCSDRLFAFWVFVSDTPFGAQDNATALQNRPGTYAQYQTAAPAPFSTFTFGNYRGRYVRVQLEGTNNLSLAEVQVFGTPAGMGTSLEAGLPAFQNRMPATNEFLAGRPR